MSRKEGGKIFGSGSRAPIAISLLVKHPHAKQHAQIYFHDIGDYLTRGQKLQKIGDFASVAGITAAEAWQKIDPDGHGDWLKQRDDSFKNFIVLGDKKGDSLKLFEGYSNGVKSNRDVWVYDSSRTALQHQINRMTEFFNSEATRYKALADGGASMEVSRFITVDRTKISWADDLKNQLRSGKFLSVKPETSVTSLYRLFTKQWLHYDRRFLWSLYHMPRIFPSAGMENLVILINASHSGHG